MEKFIIPILITLIVILLWLVYKFFGEIFREINESEKSYNEFLKIKNKVMAKKKTIQASDIPLGIVKSSNIESMGWAEETMVVKFKSGKSYSYEPVSKETYKDIAMADSIGKAFNEKVKTNSSITCTPI